MLTPYQNHNLLTLSKLRQLAGFFSKTYKSFNYFYVTQVNPLIGTHYVPHIVPIKSYICIIVTFENKLIVLINKLYICIKFISKKFKSFYKIRP